MGPPDLAVVTGAFSYTGSYIARRLLAQGKRVVTLTGHPNNHHPLAAQVPAFPFDFDAPAALTEHLRGAGVLYNTYWVRFAHGETTFERAVEYSRTLIAAAREAGVQRMVHVSITNASPDSSLPYFRGKGLVEEAILDSGLSYGILRPTLVFGVEDVLINNVAWFLRTLPVFGLPGSGDYPVRPVHVDDLAGLAVEAGGETENVTLDAVGPETYTFAALVGLIAEKIGSRARIVPIPPAVALSLARLAGRWTGDVVLTRNEVEGLTAGLLDSGGPTTAETRFSEWLEQNAQGLGLRYQSELERHYR